MNNELHNGTAEGEDLPASEIENSDEAVSPETEDAAPALRPVESKSRTTNIPPLMPAGFAPASAAPAAPEKKKKADKKREAAPVEHIGALRSASQAEEPKEPARQRRVRTHSEPGFFRRHWWWMLLVVLLAAVAVSLPWTLPGIKRWNGEEQMPVPAAADSDSVRHEPQPATVPDTAALAAREDSLRNDSLQRAAARAYWRRRAAERAAQEAQAGEEQESAAPAAAHADSVH